MSYGGAGSQGSAWFSSVVLWFQTRRDRKAGAEGTSHAREAREERIQARKSKQAPTTDEPPVTDA